jgi:hypothetical protein
MKYLMEMEPLESVIGLFWIICVILVIHKARQMKKDVVLWALFAILTGPVALLCARFAKGTVCPLCRCYVHKLAKVCEHCHRDITPTEG